MDLNGNYKLAILPDRDYSAHMSLRDKPVSLSAWERAGAVIIPAVVPGNFELDMMAAGLLADPYIGDNILKERELEDRHLLYIRQFETGNFCDTEPYLVLEGVDTVSDVYIDGILVGHTDNMLIHYELPLLTLKEGQHELSIHIHPTMREALRETGSFGDISLSYAAASLHVRKAAHSFGWDIAPRIVSGGIWRSVRLEYRPRMRIAETYLVTESLDTVSQCAQLFFYYRLVLTDIERLSFLHIRLEGVCGNSRFVQEFPVWHSTGKQKFTLEDAQLWWPKNRGPQSLYNVTVTLYDGERVLDTRDFRFGVREVELRRVHGEPGNEYFGFVVNHESVFIQGTNWVPADAFHSRDAGRIDRMLMLANDIGCNMLRCWGGNVYEDEPFFDRCDELGILVWQDFAMACGCYPQHTVMQERLRHEAEIIVKKLRQHPSLVIWAGDNECDMAMYHAPRRDPNGNVLTRRVLPEVLYSHDSMRPYLPSSPYIDEEDYLRGNMILMEDHLWGSRVYYKGDEYDKSKTCFASEIGYHGCPSPESIRRFISPDNMWPADDNEWILHSTAMEPGEKSCFGYRKQLMFNQVKLLFGQEMTTLEDFALASQISQMEAYKHFIELFRAYKDRRSGIIWWNLIDCWPQFSDSVVDYYFTKKLAYHVIREVQKPVAVLFREPQNGYIPLILVNDMRLDVQVNCNVYAVEEQGLKQLTTMHATVNADGLSVICNLPDPEEQSMFLAEWQWDGGEGRNYFLTGKPPYDFAWVKERLLLCDILHMEGFGENDITTG